MDLNLVETTVTLAGKKIHFVSLKLVQSYNQHHSCEVLVDFEELDSSWMNDPVKIIKNLSKSLVVAMKHKQTGESNTFTGVVKDISLRGRHGQQNHILIHAVSETIKLEGKPSMDSFVNQTLEEIVNESVRNFGNAANVIVKPKYTKPIEYICRHKESTFQFLNRLSWLYGEQFFSDNGSDIYFGTPTPKDTVSLKYDIEVTSLDIRASLSTPSFQRFGYLVSDDEERIKPTRYEVPEPTGYLKVAVDKSDGFYSQDNTLPLEANVQDSDSILKMVDMERARTLADMLVLSGTSQTCKVGIGRIVNIVFPKDMKVTTSAGNFVITDVVHEVSQEGIYSNSFSGIRAALEVIPMEEVSQPLAQSERAIVVSNADPDGMGRVQVQFQWQRYLNKNTNWIRVQSPDAGSSNMFRKNRGFVFIPENYDEVVINFENSNPSKPFVSGSLFSTKKGEGGNENNHLKSIKTRNGHVIQFDDSDENLSITIKDKNDNSIYLDTKNKELTIKSIEKINILSKVISLAGDEINLTSKQTISTSKERLSLFSDDKISIHADDTIDMESFNILNISAKESYVKGKDSIEISANDVSIGAENDLLASGNFTTVNAESELKLKSPSIKEQMTSDTYPFKEKVVKREAVMSQSNKKTKK